MAHTEAVAIAVEDASHVSAARHAVQRMAQGLGFDEMRTGEAAIVATEVVSNIVKHARRGTLLARAISGGPALGIELLAIDSGPGIESFARSSRDGFSTTGTPGTGLGAIQRLASGFEVFTRRGGGTIVRMVVWDREGAREPPGYTIGAISVPKSGEDVCGDAWGSEVRPRGATFVVADGLGHGPDASHAAQAAVDVLRRHPAESAIRILDFAHAKLRATRGAAVAVARHDADTGEIAFAGIGNIAACILEGEERRAMVSHNGIVGHNVAKSQEFQYRWPPKALFVAHSDGLQSQWTLDGHPGLAECHPSIIAAMLFREHSRGRDDVTVVVARAPAGSGTR